MTPSPQHVPGALRSDAPGAPPASPSAPGGRHPDETELEIWVLVDEHGRLLHRSASTSRLLGMSPVPIAGGNALAEIHPDDLAGARRALREAARRPGSVIPVSVRVLASSGVWHELLLEVCDRRDDDRFGGIVACGIDATERRFAEIASRLESTLLASLPTSVIVTDDDGTCVYWNETATELYGFSRAEAIGRPVIELNVGPSGEHAAIEIMTQVLEQGQWEGEYDARRADGSIVPIHSRMVRIEDPVLGFRGIAGASIDVSDRRQLEEDLAFQALHDDLTGLPNRRLLVEHIEMVAGQAAGTGSEVTLVVLDLDDFSDVNSRFGAVVSDEAMRVVARTLSSAAGGAVVARIGGDEFAVCTGDRPDLAAAVAMAEQLLHRLGEPTWVMGEQLELSASAGVVHGGGDARSAEAMLRRARAAMYDAKRRGRGCIQPFDPDTVPGTVPEDPLVDALRRPWRTGRSAPSCSRRSTCSAARSSASRRSPDGEPPTGTWTPASSSRWRRSTGSSPISPIWWWRTRAPSWPPSSATCPNGRSPSP